jgi:type II secretory pathway component PulJ
MRSLETTRLADTKKAQAVLDLHVTTLRKHDTQLVPRLTEKNLEQSETLVLGKGYDDQTCRQVATLLGEAAESQASEVCAL